MRPRFVLVPLLLVAVAWSGVAQADVLPPDGCTMPGQPCQNAGPLHNQSGICSPATCTKQLPSWDAPMSYPCSLCQVTDAGVSTGTAGAAGGGQGGSAGGQGGASGAAGASATGGTLATGGSTSHGSSGCAIVPVGPARNGVEILVVLIAAGLAVARRRRHASR